MPPRVPAYVPGCRNDVFISYCSQDNLAEVEDRGSWISLFADRLAVRLKKLLGAPVAVWRDERRLGGAHALDDELRAQAEGSAVFLAVVTPLYLRSRYCAREREWFLRAAGSELRVGSRLRAVRVVKTPHLDGAHREVFEAAIGFEFFRDVDGDLEEFGPASPEFDERFRKLCGSIRGLLESMRRRRVPVYVAQGAPDTLAARDRLAVELGHQGYRVLPDVQISFENLDRVARRGLEPAELSVHLFGVEEHEASVRQARIAMELRRPVVVWASRPELYRLDTDYGRFLRELMQYQDAEGRSQYLDRTRLERVKTEVLDLLRPHPEVRPTSPRGSGRVYILCDGHEESDYREAWQVKRWIVDRDGLQVDLPETAPLDPADLRADHLAKLHGCDGLLLYWGEASDAWFETTKCDLAARPFRSGAVALGAPDRRVAEVPAELVIPLYDTSGYEALEPFLQPLRQ